MSSVIRSPRAPHVRPLVGAARAILAGLGEGAWMLGALLLAIVAVAFFVLVTELPLVEGSFGDALKTPVNLVRVAVLASAAWLWSYIQRAIRRVPAREENAPAADDPAPGV